MEFETLLDLERSWKHLGVPGEVIVSKSPFKAVLVHDPLGLLAAGGSAFVEDEGFLHPQEGPTWRTVNLLVFAGGFPVAGSGGSVGPQSGRVLPVPEAEEVPLSLPHLRHICIHIIYVVNIYLLVSFINFVYQITRRKTRV